MLACLPVPKYLIFPLPNSCEFVARYLMGTKLNSAWFVQATTYWYVCYMSFRPITGFTRKGKVSGALIKDPKLDGCMCSSDPSIHPSITTEDADRTGRDEVLPLPDALSRPGRRRRNARRDVRRRMGACLPACLPDESMADPRPARRSIHLARGGWGRQ
jgi:hypothetical protein